MMIIIMNLYIALFENFKNDMTKWILIIVKHFTLNYFRKTVTILDNI